MAIRTPEQDLLSDYLIALRIPLINRLGIMLDLEDQDATMEMLCYIAETEETDLAKLSKKACEIGRKYQRDWEDIDEEETLDETETARDL